MKNQYLWVFLLILCFTSQISFSQSCPNDLQNQSSSIQFSSHRLGGGADSVVGIDDNGSCGVRVSNTDTGQPWAKYQITIDLATNNLVPGDQLNISLETYVESGAGRFEIVEDDTANTSLLSKSYFDNSSPNLSGTITVPSGISTLDIWMHTNYTLSNQGGSVIYKNLLVEKVGAGNTPVTGVTVSPTATSLDVGQTQQLTATISPNDATNQNVTWSSSDETIATVDPTGLVLAIAESSTPITITATTVDGGFEATSTITVNTSSGGGGNTLWIQNGSNIHYDNGNVGIGISDPSHKLQVDGNIRNRGYIAVEDSSGSYKVSMNGQSDGYIAGRDNNYDQRFLLRSNGISFLNGGNVGIGTSTPDEKLAVNGNIHAKEVRVDLQGWPDYVFSVDYNLPTLEEIQKHIQEKGHLPNIPSAKEVEANGVQLGEMNRLLLEKIEELTLYILEQEKRIQKLEKNK